MSRRIPVGERYPQSAEEFVENLTRPGVGVDELGVQAKDSCRWRCREHGIEWVTTVASRTQNQHRWGGCKQCNAERGSIARRTSQPRTSALLVSKENPVVASEFVENLTTPGRGPNAFTVYCKDFVRWRCAICEFEYEQRVAARVSRVNPRCSNCNTGGQRLLEVQCAALVSARFGGIAVLVGQRINNLRPDLWLPEHQVGIDLDPEWSHRDKLERDVRKAIRCLDNMAGFARIREAGLPSSGTWDYWVTKGADIDEWAHTTVAALEPLIGPPSASLTPEQRLNVLHVASQRWSDEQSDPFARSFAGRYPDLAARFVSNLTRPGIGPSIFAPNSNYECMWTCVHGFEYKTRPLTVARGGGARDCPECAGIRNRGSAERVAAMSRARKGLGQPEAMKIQRDARWNFMYAILANFIGREGHALVPSEHAEWEVNLGRWVVTQRSHYNGGSLLTERAERLATLPGWTWRLRDESPIKDEPAA